MAVPEGLISMEHTVSTLVTRVRDGDLDAFAGLMARFRPQFSRYAWQMLGNREEAEEALQDTFVRAFRAIAGCRDPERFGAWAFAILVNRCRSARRRMLRRAEVLTSDEGAIEDASVPHPEGDDAWREEIQRALSALPAAQREAFLLKHVEGLSYEEMASLSGVGIPALKMRVLRACDALRRELEGAFHG
jgi:RNA polymerase sigma-70 factor (ECF subfamily)